MSLVVASCGGSSNSSEKIAQLEDSIARMNSSRDIRTTNSTESNSPNNPNNPNPITNATDNEESVADNIIGAFKVEDTLHKVWIIDVNTDKTATVSQEGTGNVCYGSWGNSSDYPLVLHFSSDNPQITFPTMDTGFDYGYIKDGYLYKTQGAVDAKNPKLRLAITKVK